MDTQIISYLDKYVFDVIDKVIKNSNLKIVISVGKAYFDIFENKVSGFNKLEEILAASILGITRVFSVPC